MDATTVESYLKEKIRDIPDWPQKGVLFRDITTLLKDPQAFTKAVDALEEKVKRLDFESFVAVESRGFIFGSVLADRMKKGLIPVRKPGKLPYETISESYGLEYGTDTLAMHIDAVSKGAKVVLIDDLIATGGSALAVTKLVETLGGQVSACLFLIELTFLDGREKLKNYEVHSVIRY
jgi:adenine phosphoribosyltransferase